MKKIFYFILYIVKSVHLWAWLIFISGALYAYYHSKLMTGIAESDRVLQGIEDFFIFIMGVAVWFMIYTTIIFNEE